MSLVGLASVRTENRNKARRSELQLTHSLLRFTSLAPQWLGVFMAPDLGWCKRGEGWPCLITCAALWSISTRAIRTQAIKAKSHQVSTDNIAQHI